MSIITKEWLRSQISAIKTVGITDSNTLQAFEIALASLEAEPVARVISEPDKNLSGEYAITTIGRIEKMPYGTKLYTAPPAPVSVPTFDEWLEIRGNKPLGWVKDAMRESYDACRAAMLQGAEPVTKAYKLPDDFDFDRFNDVTWLDAVASNPHMHSLTTSTIAMVALELNKRLEAGNTPVIPDGWVACSERILNCQNTGQIWQS